MLTNKNRCYMTHKYRRCTTGHLFSSKPYLLLKNSNIHWGSIAKKIKNIWLFIPLCLSSQKRLRLVLNLQPSHSLQQHIQSSPSCLGREASVSVILGLISSRVILASDCRHVSFCHESLPNPLHILFKLRLSCDTQMMSSDQGLKNKYFHFWQKTVRRTRRWILAWNAQAGRNAGRADCIKSAAMILFSGNRKQNASIQWFVKLCEGR